MSDPKRLLDDSELSEDERRLLVAGAAMAPPSTLGADVWAGLTNELPGPGAGSPPGAPDASGGGAVAAPHVAMSALLIKAAAAVLALGLVVLAGRAWFQRDATPSARPNPALSAAPRALAPEASSAPPVTALPEPAPAPSAHPALPSHPPVPQHSSKAPHASVTPSASGSDASEESRMVAAARDALRSGNSASALSLLDQARQRFGNGVLGQEREALLIEALSKSGQRAAARTRGEAFLKSYANSPYAARIRTLIGN